MKFRGARISNLVAELTPQIVCHGLARVERSAQERGRVHHKSPSKSLLDIYVCEAGYFPKGGHGDIFRLPK